MKIDQFIEVFSGILESPEDLVAAFEEARHLGMNHLYVLMRNEDLRVVIVIHMNPFSEDLVSLVLMIPLGCGENQPSMEEVNKLARELGGAVMAYGDCSSILVGYDGTKDPGEFIRDVSSKVLGRRVGGRFSVEHYSYDLFTEYLEGL